MQRSCRYSQGPKLPWHSDHMATVLYSTQQLTIIVLAVTEIETLTLWSKFLLLHESVAWISSAWHGYVHRLSMICTTAVAFRWQNNMVLAGNFGWKLLVTISDAPYKYTASTIQWLPYRSCNMYVSCNTECHCMPHGNTNVSGHYYHCFLNMLLIMHAWVEVWFYMYSMSHNKVPVPEQDLHRIPTCPILIFYKY